MAHPEVAPVALSAVPKMVPLAPSATKSKYTRPRRCLGFLADLIIQQIPQAIKPAPYSTVPDDYKILAAADPETRIPFMVAEAFTCKRVSGLGASAMAPLTPQTRRFRCALRQAASRRAMLEAADESNDILPPPVDYPWQHPPATRAPVGQTPVRDSFAGAAGRAFLKQRH